VNPIVSRARRAKGSQNNAPTTFAEATVNIGVCEFLGGVGLLLPTMTGVKPKLTPFGAFGLMLVMLLAAAFHIARGEYNFVPINLLLGGIAAFIAYGPVVCEAPSARVDQHLPRT
jgi:DoxX-like family